MTLDNIIRMAREAGFALYFANERFNQFERFAALAAAAEREACAVTVDRTVPAEKMPGNIGDGWHTIKICSAAIRARGLECL